MKTHVLKGFFLSKNENTVGIINVHNLKNRLDIHVFVHHDIIYENNQEDATVHDSLLFLGCSTCFGRYFRSSSGASKLYYSVWYYTRMSLPAGISRQRHACVIPDAVIQFRCS